MRRKLRNGRDMMASMPDPRTVKVEVNGDVRVS